MDFASVLRTLGTATPGRTEADIQADVKLLLQLGDFIDGETPLLESQTADGSGRRIDILYGALVIECKKKVDPASRKQLALDENQLAGYLADRQATARELYTGILTDGRRWRHYRLVPDGGLVFVSEIAVDQNVGDDRPFRDWLGSALPTETKIRPTAPTIEGRLGAGSPTHDITVGRLTELLAGGDSIPEVVLKRELWAKLLRTAFGTQFEGTDVLFVEHTYLVLLATLIAHTALGMPTDTPVDRLLSGEDFSDAGITGVGEAGFFDWVLAVDGGSDVVADVHRRIGCFDWSLTDHDVLKALYQSVVSPEVRHRLGEYYTPDWLADRMVRTVVADPLHDRVLDPACGSGTFLFAAVTRYFEAARAAGVPTTDAVDRLAGHVAGIDLHPVAVSLAQVTYLLAVGLDRLAERSGPFAVPVYLGDSMRWGDASADSVGSILHPADDVVVQTTDDAELFATELRFPAGIVARPDFDALVTEMAQRASSRVPGSPRPSIRGVLDRYAGTPHERQSLEKTYDLLCGLHDAGRDHIWGYFVRNQAKPAWFAQSQNRVDVVVGNPPWLAYRYMPKEMQDRFRQRAEARNLWTGGNVASQQDLSAFFVVRSVELYLKNQARFAFVVPLAVLSRQSYAGFRTGRWTTLPEIFLGAELDQAWSLKGVRPDPFPVPSAVVLGRRTDPQAVKKLPASVTAVAGRASGSGPWASVESGISISEVEITSVDSEADHRSTYGDRFRNGATLFPRMLVFVEEGPPQPFATATQQSVRSRRTALEKEPWKSVGELVGVVEKPFVRPVLVGDSIVPFGVLEALNAVIPYTQTTGLLVADDPKIERYPGFAKWWKRAEEIWATHRGSKSPATLLERFDFHHELRAQFPVAPIRVVYTKAGNTLAAAVVRDGMAVVNTVLYWAPVSSIEEGRYLSAVINAPIMTKLAQPYQSIGAFGPRHFDKYIWQVPIPPFDAGDPLHKDLVTLAAEAETVASAVSCDAGFQKHRGLVREALARAGISSRLDQAVQRILA